MPDDVIDTKGAFWKYLQQNQKDLIHEGTYLMNNVIKHHVFQFHDYSFIVFPFAKAYEGFLKQIFLDRELISRLQYISDHLRLGKLLSPHLVERLGEKSLYKKLKDRFGEELVKRIWQTWKMGRNEIFHYFPHNLKAVSFDEAERIVKEIIKTMEETYITLKT